MPIARIYQRPEAENTTQYLGFIEIPELPDGEPDIEFADIAFRVKPCSDEEQMWIHMGYVTPEFWSREDATAYEVPADV